MLDLLPWLLHGSNRPEYAAKQAEAEDAWVVAQGLDLTLWCARRRRPSLSSALSPPSPSSNSCLVAIIAVRLVFNRLFAGTASRLAASRGQTPAHRDGRKLLEEAWVLCGNVAMLSMAGYIMARRNGGCVSFKFLATLQSILLLCPISHPLLPTHLQSFASLRPCLEGWPNHAADPAITLYYALELAWYAHLLLKPVLGYGLGDGRDMQIHHLVTMAMLVGSLGMNLSRMGVVALALFGISNPVLHFAKIANQLHAPWRMIAFGGFAAAFLITRVLAVPAVILVPAGLRSRQWISYAIEDFHVAYMVLNGLLWVLYGMQLVWMAAIFRVLLQAATKGANAALETAAQVDPAKRYAPEVVAAEINGSAAAASAKRSD